MAKSNEKFFFIIAGEHSGDIFASRLVNAMKKVRDEKYPYLELKFAGLGGNNLKNEGVELLENIVTKLAIIGITEVIFNIVKIYSLLKKVEKFFREKKPDAVILVDYPGFNLKVASIAKKYNIPVYYYVCPQVWAWGEKRISQIVENVRLLFTIFDFEPDIIRQSKYFPHKTKNKCDIYFIGHPLLDVLKESKYSKDEIFNMYKLHPRKKIIGLLPGSRISEVKRLLPVMLKASKRIKELYQDVQFILPVAQSIGKPLIELHLQQENMEKEVKVFYDKDYSIRRVLDFAIVASGTATLELAFLEVPMVIVYKINYLGYLIAKRLVNVKNIGLVNIIHGKQVVPECIQEMANEKIITEIVIDFLTNQKKIQDMKNNLKSVKERVLPDRKLRERYNSKSPSYCAANIIMETLINEE